MTPAQAIVAASKNGAIACKKLADFGTIEAGKAADLLILDANPLEDIRNIRKVRTVMSGGRAIETAKLPERPVLSQLRVRLETSKGPIVVELHRDWAPLGVERFFTLVRSGYYDGVRFHRVIAGKWAQFGVNGDPRISKEWRTRTFADEPRKVSNTRGTVAFAFAVPNGRTTQVFINLRDNSPTHDAEPFVPIGRVVEGINVADALYADYAEQSGGGIRGGKQGPMFEQGNAWLERNFPRLDYIVRATVE